MNETRVYSYRRFSSGRQATGHSIERQSASARAWCLENKYTLDEELAISDLGVSAYSGKNAAEGALAIFLAAAKAGKVPRGSILLVESLDRLSRAAIHEAVGLLTAIVTTGVRVVSMLDNKEWNEETIKDTMNFMLSVLLFSRAHEESATKAKRVRAAVLKKRAAQLPVVTTVHGPGWAYPREDMQGWVVDEELAACVVKVFEMAANGRGGIAIARIANTEGWPLPWRKRANSNPKWEHTQISRMLRDRRVLGEWQPKRMSEGQLVNDGQPVLDYFPRVVSDELWFKVQNALTGRPGPVRLRGIKSDIFAGLLYCRCGKRMERKAPAERGYARYYCLARRAGITECPPISEAAIVEYGLPVLAEMEHEAFSKNQMAIDARDELLIANEKLSELNTKAERLLDAIEQSGGSQSILDRLSSLEKERAGLENVVKEKRATLETVPSRGILFAHQIANEAAAAIADKDAVEARHKISIALAQLLSKIEWYHSFLMFSTKKGVAITAMIPKEATGRAKRVTKKQRRAMSPT
jgi:DNA invertase Pin-like site-specific DNA recombinase